MKKLGYVRIQFPGQPIEDAFMQGLSNLEVRSVGWLSEDDKTYNLSNVRFSRAEMKKLLPEFIANFFVRKPYSAVSFAVLQDIEKHLVDADIIYTTEPYSFLSRQCAEYSEQNKKKLVISCFETIPNSPQLKLPPYVFNVRYVKNKADLFVAYTNKAAACLKAISIPDEKIKVVYPGIDVEFFYPNKIEHENIRILFVGRFDREKGLDVLLTAFKMLFEKIRGIELWIVGPIRSGETYELARAMAEKYPIKIIGAVPREMLPEIYNQCDIFCAPSIDKKKFGVKVWEEQFGAVFVEAMACGLPVVSTKCGAIPEIVGEHNITLRQNCSKELYASLNELIKDGDSIKQIAIKNRARVESIFDLRRNSSKLEKVLIEL